MAYSEQTWADGQTGGTPITAARLQHIEDGIAAADVVDLTDLPAGSVVFAVQNSGGTWGNRPTSRLDVHCRWIRIVSGSTNPPSATTPGTTVDGAYPNDVVEGA